MRIIINGIGIAGPTLAYWLRRSGHEVVLVEEAPRLRRAGYVVDFWGLGYDIAERMGIISRIHDLGYHMREVRIVDRRGKRIGGFTTEVFHRLTKGRFTSLRRSDISATIYEALGGDVETIFGDSVARIDPDGPRVHVSFDHAAPREADLVIGADGLHSRVRRLAFGTQDWSEVPLGYHVAAFEAKGYEPREDLTYISHAIPGRQISRFSLRDDVTLFLFIFRDDYLPDADLSGEHNQKAAITRVFAEVGWEAPKILAALATTKGIYFDTVSQIRMKRWTAGRTALIGDAAACVSLMAGEGSGLAMAEAYVLAGELRNCGEDFDGAFARYQHRMMPFLAGKQASALKFASAFAPKTAFGLAFRNVVTRVMGVPAIADYFIGRDLKDMVEIPDYGF